MKIIRKLVFVLVILACMIITVNAELLAPGQSTPNVISLNEQYKNGSPLRYNPITFAGDAECMVIAGSGYPRPTIALWQSRITAGEFYKINIEMSVHPSESPEYGVTGFLEKSDDMCVYLVDATTLIGDIDTSVEKYGITQWGRQVGLSEEDRLPDNAYQMFYDKTEKKLSVLLMTETTMTNYYVVVRLGRFDNSMTQAANIIYKYSTVHIEGAYTDILNDIKQILEESTASGGDGLTEEQLDQAIQAALAAHDQHLQSDVQQQGTQADQLVEQLGAIVPAVKLQTALQGLTAAVSGNHRTCVLTLPEIIEPVTGGKIMEQTSIDLTGTIQGIINGDSRIGTLVDLIRWINLLVLAFSLIRSIMNIISYVTSGGDQGE